VILLRKVHSCVSPFPEPSLSLPLRTNLERISNESRTLQPDWPRAGFETQRHRIQVHPSGFAEPQNCWREDPRHGRRSRASSRRNRVSSIPVAVRSTGTLPGVLIKYLELWVAVAGRLRAGELQLGICAFTKLDLLLLRTR
jgi:hypothetical protein